MTVAFDKWFAEKTAELADMPMPEFEKAIPHDTLSEWEYCIRALRLQHKSEITLRPEQIVRILDAEDARCE